MGKEALYVVTTPDVGGTGGGAEEGPRWLPLREAARVFNRDPQTVYRWVWAVPPKVRFRKDGSRYLIDMTSRPQDERDGEGSGLSEMDERLARQQIELLRQQVADRDARLAEKGREVERLQTALRLAEERTTRLLDQQDKLLDRLGQTGK